MNSGEARIVVQSPVNDSESFDSEISTESVAREMDAQKKSNMSNVAFAVMFFSVVSTLGALGAFTSKLVVSNQEDGASHTAVVSLVLLTGLCLSAATLAGLAKANLFVSSSRESERQSIIPHSFLTNTKMMLREWINKHILQSGAVTAATLYGGLSALIVVASESQNPPGTDNAGPIAAGYLLGYAMPLMVLIAINLYYVRNNRTAELQAFFSQLRTKFNLEESTPDERQSLTESRQPAYSSLSPRL